MLPNLYFVYVADTVLSNTDDGTRCRKISGASCNTYVFFHFVLQEELTTSKVILLPLAKFIVRVSYLFATFWKIYENRAGR